jgi:hypothetical protein
MDRRKTKEFNDLLTQYEEATYRSGKKPGIFRKMLRQARTFSDWASIYQYGDDDIRKKAEEKMKRRVIREEKDSYAQLNIMELFLVIDQGDKLGILKRYIKKFHEKDSLLFVLEMMEGCSYETNCADGGLVRKTRAELRDKYYGTDGKLEVGLSYRYKRTEKLWEKATFNP